MRASDARAKYASEATAKAVASDRRCFEVLGDTNMNIAEYVWGKLTPERRLHFVTEGYPMLSAFCFRLSECGVCS